MTRQEHLEWAKKRAMEYVHAGDFAQAFASMASDLRKHEELENHAGMELGAMLMMGGFLNTQHDMQKFIEGFN